ncbi:amino acid ABC transporter ATP-binding protein [Bifidobacterium avesanii]|uniref:ATP-binding cassette domain-containing protein n=1 Tax=Bifidobacterium avesanii TaxID=1798157 RepID=A0A7K3TJR1_9BIFI|nr:amino acid ABC transporter ATP-binding protein [Bifidobacterium avesanii]KAB8287267.1 polar amino acid ABC transporter ATP-binding protein [Bifidobacterium avesanii]NEG79345.1 ATP-binding cassette domain-containing protein [Bifidobacterium avesanii]
MVAEHNPDYILEIGSLGKRFGDKTVFSDVSLRVRAGEVCSIIGPSGTGKSTFLRCINQLETPDSGNMWVAGQYIEAGMHLSGSDLIQLRRNVGMVFQSFNLFPNMSVLQNVVFPQQKVLSRSAEESRDKAMDLLGKVGLADRAEAKPMQLSGGQQQRVAIARALALEPKIMLFDEPTSALDPEVGLDILNIMRDLAKSGMTMLVVTHEMAFARDVGDHLVVMGDGGILEEGDPDQIMSHPSKERTRRFLRAVLGR